MDMKIEQAYLFLEKYAAGHYTEEEHEAFLVWLSSAPAKEIENLVARYELISEQLPAKPSRNEALIAKIESAIDNVDTKVVPIKNNPVKWWWTVAASLILGICGYLLYSVNHTDGLIASTFDTNLTPGTNGAVLTLADGSQVTLDSLGNGVIAQQSGKNILLQGGQLNYSEHVPAKHTSQSQYNILSTPKGRQFQILLPDGTHAWLNAASYIKYPVAFNGSERRVEISGEVYFDVHKDPEHPFMVAVKGNAHSKGGLVEALGTSFNINAYDNEPIQLVTLTEGSVRVTDDKTGQSALLRPSQQASYSDKQNLQVKQVNTKAVLAWKDGYFDFEDADLHSLLRQVERWYDVEVIFEKNAPNIEFGGKMSRNVVLTDVLNILKDYGVRYEMKADRKLYILSPGK